MKTNPTVAYLSRVKMKHEKMFTENFSRLRNFSKKSQRKAQGLSLTTIVIAALVLIVLVVLIIIFGGQTKIFTGGIKSCESSGGLGCYTDCEYETVTGAGTSLKAGTMLVSLPGTTCSDEKVDGKPVKTCCKIVYGGKE